MSSGPPYTCGANGQLSDEKLSIDAGLVSQCQTVQFCLFTQQKKYEGDPSSGDKHVLHLEDLFANSSIVCAH